MEKNSQFKVPARKVDWPDIHANSTTAWSTITSLIYGIALESVINLS